MKQNGAVFWVVLAMLGGVGVVRFGGPVLEAAGLEFEAVRSKFTSKSLDASTKPLSLPVPTMPRPTKAPIPSPKPQPKPELKMDEISKLERIFAVYERQEHTEIRTQ